MIIAVRGDTQTGDASSLLNPETPIPAYEIDDAGERVQVGIRNPELRPIQDRLWKWHEQGREDIGKLAGEDPIVLLEMGDMTQGNRFSDDLAENNLSAQVIESIWSVKPWMDMPNLISVYVTRGTGVHVWGEGSSETLVTGNLRLMYPDKKVQIADHYLLTIDNFTIDIAHHGPFPGSRNWLKGNVVELYAKSVMMDDIAAGKQPPNAMLRAHFHEMIYRPVVYQAGGNCWEMPTWITPPYCGINSHAVKVAKSPARMGVGLLALEIVNGKLYDWHKFTHVIDLRAREVV